MSGLCSCRAVLHSCVTATTCGHRKLLRLAKVDIGHSLYNATFSVRMNEFTPLAKGRCSLCVKLFDKWMAKPRKISA